jgi:uncharacterized membrane protein
VKIRIVARYRFAHFLAGLLSAVGTMLIVLGCALAVLLSFAGYRWAPDSFGGQQWLERSVGPAVVVLGGLLLGGPLIVIGQFLRVLLGQRQLLSRIDQRLRRREQSPQSAPEREERPSTGRFGRPSF